MVPKRSQPSGSGQPDSPAARHPCRISRDGTPPPEASELTPAPETEISNNAATTTAEETKLRPLSATGVAEAIEHERVELMQIQAMLKCLYEVLLYADDDDSVMHADVANVCARLIDDCVCRLDALLMHGGKRASGDDLDDAAASEACDSPED